MTVENVRKQVEEMMKNASSDQKAVLNDVAELLAVLDSDVETAVDEAFQAGVDSHYL